MERITTNIPNVESVRWAYRFILGREPENDEVLGNWASLADGRLILAYFAQSPEAARHRAAGCPMPPGYAGTVTPAAAVQAAFHLRFNAIPSAREVASEIAATPDFVTFRSAFLASDEVQELSVGEAPAPVPAAPMAAPTAAPTAAVLVSRIAEGGFTVLGQDFSLRGAGGEEYWRSMVDGPPDPTLERLARLVRAAFPDGGQGRVLADVGANIGITSLVMAAAAPGHAALLCFEPDARSLPLLQHNLAANDLGQALGIGVALAERDGVAQLRCGADNTATSVLVEGYSRAQSAGADLREVPVRRLDSVLAELEMTRLDLLKIDVEGGETPVLLGAGDAIARDRPIIFLEFNLWTQMTAGARNPLEVLEEWSASFRHVVAFDRNGLPFAITDHDGLLWVLHTVMTERNCVDDLILCDDLAWLDRW